MRKLSTKQSAITIMAPLSCTREQRADLEDRLRSLGRADLEMAKLHFMSCTISDPKCGAPSYVILEFNVDGDADSFLDAFFAKNASLVRDMLSRCEGFPAASVAPDPGVTLDERQVRSLRRFVERCRRKHITFHRGNPGRSVEQILEEQDLLESVAEVKDRHFDDMSSRAALWDKIKGDLNSGCNKCIEETPRRPWRVILNPANPETRRWLGGAFRLLAQVVLVVVGLWLASRAVQSNRAWLILVLGVPLLVMALRLWLDLLEAPKRLQWRVRFTVLLRIVGTTLIAGVWVAAVAGLVAGVYTTHLSEVRDIVVPVFNVLMSVALVTTGALVAYLTMAAGGAMTVAIVIGGLLVAAAYLLPNMNAFFTYVGVAALVAVTLLLFATLALLLWLRAKESDDVVDDRDEDIARTGPIKRREQQNQNHFASITIIKPGRRRRLILKMVLRAVHLGSYFVENRGSFGGFSTIHFARFVLLPGERELLFLSNYDGGFQRYLGDFQRSRGVTAIWGHTGGFPRPFFLLYRGATDGERFIRYARNSQIESLVWYSAYEISVRMIDDASTVRRDLMRPIDTKGQGYRVQLKRLVKRPLSEADMAAALKRMEVN